MAEKESFYSHVDKVGRFALNLMNRVKGVFNDPRKDQPSRTAESNIEYNRKGDMEFFKTIDAEFKTAFREKVVPIYNEILGENKTLRQEQSHSTNNDNSYYYRKRRIDALSYLESILGSVVASSWQTELELYVDKLASSDEDNNSRRAKILHKWIELKLDRVESTSDLLQIELDNQSNSEGDIQELTKRAIAAIRAAHNEACAKVKLFRTTEVGQVVTFDPSDYRAPDFENLAIGDKAIVTKQGYRSNVLYVTVFLPQVQRVRQ